MPRAKGGYKTEHRRNRIRKQPRDSAADAQNSGRQPSRPSTTRGGSRYFHRRKRKGDFRGLWIVRINAAARELGISYSQASIAGLAKANIAHRSQDPLGSGHQRSERLQEDRRSGAGGLTFACRHG